MKKNSKIQARRDFLKIAQSGFYFKFEAMVVQSDLNNLDRCRVGVTASKKVGNAVVRNKCKRRMRALADAIIADVGMNGVDYVFIARPATRYTHWLSLLNDTRRAILVLNRKLLKCRK
ncbi:MAG: ribonuclease P protein component [Holosporaceae bacterium]|nr:ribonuclease P protein component [Holosporaceae bacterium]